MPKCIDQEFPCQNPDYSEFDNKAKIELRNPASANEIVNESWYCQNVPASEFLEIGDLNRSKFLRPLRGKFGIYHLWSEYEHCDDHKTFTMKCKYVGKGPPDTRVASHVKRKWQKNEILFVTIHECANRLAKYYEQLFLDTYHFDLNEHENSGVNTLYAVWDDERFRIGTHLNEISALSQMESPDDW